MLKYFDLETKRCEWHICLWGKKREERDKDGYKERERTIEEKKSRALKE